MEVLTTNNNIEPKLNCYFQKNAIDLIHLHIQVNFDGPDMFRLFLLFFTSSFFHLDKFKLN